MATPVILKGSLFDEAPLGAIACEGPLPEVGDVIEHEGKQYTITELIDDDAAAYAATGAEGKHVVAIVEPLAMSQRRSRIPPPSKGP